MLKNKILVLHYNNHESRQLIQRTLQDVYDLDESWNFKEAIVKNLVLRNKYYEMVTDWYLEDIGDSPASFDKWFQEFTDHDQYEMLYECLAGIILIVPPTRKNSDTHKEICLHHLEQLHDFLDLKGHTNKFFILFEKVNPPETEALLPIQNGNANSDLQTDSEDELESFIHSVIDFCSTTEEIKNSLDIYDWLDHEENKAAYSLVSKNDDKTVNTKPQLDLAQLLSTLEKEKLHYHTIKNPREAESYLSDIIDSMSNLLLDEQTFGKR